MSGAVVGAKDRKKNFPNLREGGKQVSEQIMLGQSAVGGQYSFFIVRTEGSLAIDKYKYGYIYIYHSVHVDLSISF